MAGTYSANLANPDLAGGLVSFTAPDNLGETFFIFQDFTIRNISELAGLYYFPDMELELAIDQNETTAEKLAILTSDFPAPSDQLPDSVLRVSDVISVFTFPVASDLAGQIEIRYEVDSLEATVPEAMKIYKFENAWKPLETRVDLFHQTVNANLDGSGFYAAFLDLTQSRLVTDINEVKPKVKSGLQLYSNYPNPFHSYTTIRFELPVASKVTLEVFDIFGRKISVIIDQSLSAGDHSAVWDCRDDQGNSVSPGVYFCVLKCGTMNLNQKMVLIR